MRVLSLTAVALLALAPASVVAQAPPLPEETDEGCPEQRILEYIERHGDFGRIDPEVMLELAKETKRDIDSRRFAPLGIDGNTWKSIGPTNGAGRATAVAVHPTIGGTAIIGAAGGGAWKTIDGGATWRALTDNIPNLSVGAIAYAPSDPNTVYLGTGEGGYAGDFIPGIGLLMSSDGGETWTLPASVMATQFYRLLVNPTNSQDVLAATNNGLLRSTSGQNGPWKPVINSTPLQDAPGYGDVTELVRDPSDAKILYATTWDRRAWCAKTATTCSAALKFESPTVMKSVDGGATWTPVANGLPVSTSTRRVNRMSIAIAPSAPGTLFVATSILDSESGREISHIYKSMDGGVSWEDTNVATITDSGVNTYLGTQAWYDNAIVVSPTDPNLVIAGGIIYVRSTDGGITWTRVMRNVHVDAHDLRYDSAGALWIANDGGIWTASADASQFTDRNKSLVTRQFYDLANDPVNRNRVYGGQQDNGTIYRGDIGGTSWSGFSGGDGFACAVIPVAPSVAFSTIQNGVVLRTMTAGSLYRAMERTPPYQTDELKPFYSIVKVDPKKPATVYAVSYRIWKSTSAGEGWVPLSTKLTGGGTWPADATIRTLAIAPTDSNVIMVATGAPRRRVYRTTDGGQLWTDVTSNLPPGRTILKIDINPRDPQNAFAALAGTSGPSVYITSDGGLTWTARALGLPSFSAQTVRFDPTDPRTLYAGTDVGVYRSIDSGKTWERFGNGMPAVSVYDIDPTADGLILRAATHGRGVWELDIPNAGAVAPSIVISKPTTNSVLVPQGTTIAFSGFVKDTIGSDSSATWTFTDSWSSIQTQAGATINHRFDRPGIYPVALSAIDSKGAVIAQSVEVDVIDPSDSCFSPNVIPGDGPFPFSITTNTELSTKETADPRGSASCYPFTTQSSTWFTFTPVTGGEYQFSLCGSEVSAVLMAYIGQSCGSFGTSAMCIARPQTSADCASSGSTQSLVLEAGQTVRLLATNYFTGDLGAVTVTVTQDSRLSPIVKSVAPSVGVAGSTVVINGLGFATGATVSINGTPARDVAVISPTTISATVPVNASGNVNVTVINPDDASATLKEGFTYEFVPAPKKVRAGPRR